MALWLGAIRGGEGMPTYDFRCKECGELFAKRISFSEKDKVVCPNCSGQVEQRFTGFGLVKGGGSSSGSSCAPSGSPFT